MANYIVDTVPLVNGGHPIGGSVQADMKGEKKTYKVSADSIYEAAKRVEAEHKRYVYRVHEDK